MVERPVHILLLLAFPEATRRQYLERLRSAFPELTIDLVDHHSKVGPYIADAEVLMTFGAHMADHVLAEATRLRWVQALGTGVDGIADSPSLRDGVIVTNLHGLHGPAVSECALAGMLALARDLRRASANQARGVWQRFPVSLLHGKTVGILGVGAIAEELAPKCAALGMRVVGISSAQRQVAGFERMWPRDQLVDAVRDLDYLVLLTPYTAADARHRQRGGARGDEADERPRQRGPRWRRRRAGADRGAARRRHRRRRTRRLRRGATAQRTTPSGRWRTCW